MWDVLLPLKSVGERRIHSKCWVPALVSYSITLVFLSPLDGQSTAVDTLRKRVGSVAPEESISSSLFGAKAVAGSTFL